MTGVKHNGEGDEHARVQRTSSVAPTKESPQTNEQKLDVPEDGPIAKTESAQQDRAHYRCH
eukprot:4182807-Amphidinium_carterae.1